MERDFMGLNAKDSPVVAVKEEVVEDSKDSVFGRSSVIPLPFSSKNFAAGACVKPQLLGGNLLLPSTTVAGTTEQWINLKASKVPAQFTIFYNGTVNVFDDISPDKAEAIILLAGKGYISSNMAKAKNDVQAPVSVQGTGEAIHKFLDGPLVNQSMSTRKCSGMPSPISVSSHVAAAANNIDDDIKVPNAIAMSTALANKVEPPVMLTSSVPVASTAMMSSAVPQARKASLARFLEKRKERVMKVAPYNLSKKAADCATQESTCVGFSATSGVGSCSMSSIKEVNGAVYDL